MSRTKKLSRLRRREEERDRLITELRREVADQKSDVSAWRTEAIRALVNLQDFKLKLAPAIERTMAIRLNSQWYFPVPEERAARAVSECDRYVSAMKTRSIDTHQKLVLSWLCADEIVLEMLRGATKESQVSILAYFGEVARALIARAMLEMSGKIPTLTDPR